MGIPSNRFGAFSSPPHFGSSSWLSGLNGPKKRKVYFSFHFTDIMRVNVIRNAWRVVNPDSLLGGRTFYDSSLWESRQREDPEALKRLIREGVGYTSAVCALVGAETATRRWVRYEIARAVIDKRGLLAVHLNSIRHHKFLTPHVRGPNPLASMAVGKVQRQNVQLRQFTICSSTPNEVGFGIRTTVNLCRCRPIFPTPH
jgi:hypothetical protein